MGIKVINDNKPNQLLGVIRRQYSFINVFLITIAILSLGFCGQLHTSDNIIKKNVGKQGFLLVEVLLVTFFVVLFIISSFPFFKDAFLQISQISFPSLKQIFFNILQVFFFTSFLVLFIFCFDTLIKQLFENLLGN
ncbi:preprotein translocase subunit SecE [Candidatus Phytoplasma solani]|uniref:Preprotein translocase subunit SecE n=1 Tax=Candidatus Phytoplasma solani TaxID=69896 RepID=A0A421NYP8_9MOLU|nr:preprotein translocase subunit SecE [Candidatus Phytoplasma solani]RMI89143.1 preprotein translocase subunit SecE [Candidatus Phytoplasma solani]CCP88397.1 Protein translocase subunit SecE [Candidatus Phytoplasma solani]